jgi:hypothetical protein
MVPPSGNSSLISVFLIFIACIVVLLAEIAANLPSKLYGAMQQKDDRFPTGGTLSCENCMANKALTYFLCS